MNIITQAAYIAAHSHRNQTYGKKCYFDGHLMVVAEIAGRIARALKVKNCDVPTAIALLHDVIEDKYASKKGLARSIALVTTPAHADWIAECVKQLARDKPSESYEDYIQRLIDEKPPLLRQMLLIVKSADLIANLISSPSKSLEKRYTKALRKICLAFPEATEIINKELFKENATTTEESKA